MTMDLDLPSLICPIQEPYRGYSMIGRAIHSFDATEHAKMTVSDV
jgi:hypothetical protein